MALQLQVSVGPDAGRLFTLQSGSDNLIGRGQDCLYHLNDPRVSRAHCQIRLEGDRATVVCNGGSGGTIVNSRMVQKQELKLGDVIKIGDSQLRLQMGDFPLDVAMGGLKDAPTLESIALSPDADALEALSGQTISHYQLGHVIGTGKSKLFFATDLNNGRCVAFKILAPEFATNEEEVQRFIRGMKAALPLKHPNIVQTYGAGKTKEYCWIAMEFVAGESLKQVIDRIGVAGMLDWKVIFRAALQLARALEFAHGHGIVHRNLTPTNVLRDTPTKTFKIGDFMLAKSLDNAVQNNQMAITRPGELIGELDYMPPERTRGMLEADARGDLYGLGALTYALLTGRPPCGGGTLIEKITRIRTVTPEKPTKYQLSIQPAFEGLVMKLLAKDPTDRYQTAAEVVKELERIGKFCGANSVAQ